MKKASFLLLLSVLKASLTSSFDLCKTGSDDEVLAFILAGPQNLGYYQGQRDVHLEAQECFNAALQAENFEALSVLVGNFPLYHMLDKACQEGDEKLAVRLLKVSGLPLSGEELEKAIGSGNPELVKILLETGRFDPAGNNNKPIIEAAIRGHVDIIKLLLTYKGVDPAAQNNWPLVAAAYNGHAEVFEFLLTVTEAKKDVLESCFTLACGGGHLKIVRLLCKEYGVDPDCQSNQGLVNAAKSKNSELVKFLLAMDEVDPSDQDNEAIIMAAQYGDAKTVELLLACPKVDPAVNNCSPLRLTNSPKTIDLLLADPRILINLHSWLIDNVLSLRSSGKAKTFILNWIEKNMHEVDMSWMSAYKKICLKYPLAAGKFDDLKNNAVVKLRNLGLSAMAGLIEAWAAALKNISLWLSAEEDGHQMIDNLDMLVELSLPEYFF